MHDSTRENGTDKQTSLTSFEQYRGLELVRSRFRGQVQHQTDTLVRGLSEMVSSGGMLRDELSRDWK